MSDYVREIRKGSVVVLKRGKAMAAVVPLDAAEWEDFVVSQDPGFSDLGGASKPVARLNAGP